LRIAIFMPLSSPWSREAALRIIETGTEVHIIDFSDDFTGDNSLNQLEILHGEGIGRLRESAAAIHFINSKLSSRLRYVTCARQLGQICRRCGADLLLTLWGGGWATMTYLSGMRPYAVFAGGSDILRLTGIRKKISACALAAADVVFANGKYFAKRTSEFVPKANVIPLHYGIDVRRFVPAPRPKSPLNILCARTFRALYNNRYLIEALAEMHDVPEDLHVIFTSTGELLEPTRDLARRTLPPSLYKRIAFLNGVSDSGMVQRLQQAHIYVSFSESDGTSTSLLEAMACGSFPVLSDIPPNREWISPERNNGILVPLGQPKTLAQALHRAIADAAWRENVADNNRELVLERADGRKTMRDLVATVESILKKRRTGTSCHAH
jgi:glycosyltransferase involved in cell wall biosynthesis